MSISECGPGWPERTAATRVRPEESTGEAGPPPEEACSHAKARELKWAYGGGISCPDCGFSFDWEEPT